MHGPSPEPEATEPPEPPLRIEGGLGPAIVAVAARIARGVWPRPVAVVAAEEEDAAAWADGLALLLGPCRVERLPPGPKDPTLPVLPDPVLEARRTAALAALAGARAGSVVVGSAAAWTRRTVPPEILAARTVDLAEGTVADRDAVVAALVAAGYRRVPVVGDPGDLAVRGGLVDVAPPDRTEGVRIEWFGDEIESVRTFDLATQRSGASLGRVRLCAVRETLVTDPAGLRARIAEAADALDLPSRLVREVAERAVSGDPAAPWPALLPILHGRAVPVYEHAPSEVLWIVADPARVAARHRSLVRALEAAVERARVAPAFALPAAAYVADPDAFEGWLDRAHVVTGLADGTRRATLAVRTAPTASLVAGLGDVRRGRQALAEVLEQARPFGERTRWVLAAPSARRAAALAAAFEDGPAVAVHDGDGPRDPGALAPGIHAVVGRFPATCAVAGEDLVVVGHRELFGEGSGAVAPPRRRGIVEAGRLRRGDPVVHRLHGIGRFEGLVRLSLRGTVEEFARIVYAGGDKLYLPVLRIGEIEPYVGTGDRPPKLDRLGGHTFARRKAKVRADVAGLAEALLRLYAERAARTRPPYPGPDAGDDAFAATFPFEETPDQREAIEAVHADLSGPRPMDRLVCGDVGFGKTEVALRAIFRVAAAGRQVALLAPTTVLARQHEKTLRDRLEPFGLVVAGLHRFAPAKVRRSVVEGLRAGRVDVVVGTHRLLQKDVRFARLGLVVVDEEQRFGVRHKERLAMLRADVDVLALSATPIPRTLHMALSGLRDVSLLSTPPPDRLAVETILAAEDDRLVADAVEEEIGRGGQVFFVVPRILDLEPWRARLARVVPGARVAVAHGRMPAKALETAMLDFVEGRADVLLCTTIAENGLDIPRANTLVVAGAHRFGLSQLHQLRGRVGRSHVKARAYLLVPNLAGLGGTALGRLSAVVDHSDLGAGFDIARRDLELRGAGELLGKRQSGALAGVGFSTYARLLEEAVAGLEGRVLPDETAPEVAADVPAHVPEAYLPDPVLRLDVYRTFAAARTVADVTAAAEAVEDRFGRLPPEAEAFVELSKWQVAGRAVGAESIELARGRLVVRLAPGADQTPFRTEPWRLSAREPVARAEIGADGGALARATDLLVRAAATPRG